MDKSFAKYTPTVFIITSPFQLLCSLEALAEFEIGKSKFIFVLNADNPLPRDAQLVNMAKEQHVDYEIHYRNTYNLETILENIESPLYERAFIGDYSDIYLHLISIRYLKQNSVLLYLDDGNSTIALLQGATRDYRPTEWRKKLNWYKNVFLPHQKWTKDVFLLLNHRGIQRRKSLFTIYSDIRNKQYQLYPNTFKHIRQQIGTIETHDDCVLIIGNAPQIYSNQINIPLCMLEGTIWQKLSEVKQLYPDTKIWYIPHGRDENCNIPVFCSQLGIEYLRIDETLEYYVLKRGYHPLAIYGFFSTAILTLKRMFPNSEATTWNINKKDNNSFYKLNTQIGKYYSNNGIYLDRIPYVNKSVISTLFSNIKSMFLLLRKKTGL